MRFYHRLNWIIALALLLSACKSVGQQASPGALGTRPSSAGGSQPTRQPGCTVKTGQPTPNATLEAALPPLTEKDWVKGPQDAYVTLIEYSDFM